MKPPYDLLLEFIEFHWKNELETMFQQITTSITEGVTLALLNTKHPFFITVYFSLFGIGSVKENVIINPQLLKFLILMNKNSVPAIVNYSKSYFH